MPTYATGTTGYIGSKLRNSIPLTIDLANQKDFSKLIILPESTIIHLAAIVGEQKVLQNPAWARKVNIEGTLLFAEHVRDHTDSRFIFVSSSHVYKISNGRLDENSPVEPKSSYAKMKLEAEERLTESYKSTPERLLIVRIFSILGRDMSPGTLGWAIEHANIGTPVNNSDDLRDFSTANEVAELLERLARVAWISTVLNVCSGTCQTVRDAGRKLRGELMLSDEENIFLSGNSMIPRICGDNGMLLKTLSKEDE